jgi:hypothetical protein
MKRLIIVFAILATFTPHAGAQTGVSGGVLPYSRFTVFDAPAFGNQATITRAAAVGVNSILVADCIYARYVAGTTAPSATTINLLLRDGASGVGTVIWQTPISLPASASAEAHPIAVCGLNIAGSAGTAMTLEFSLGVSNTSQSVSLTGYVQRP